MIVEEVEIKNFRSHRESRIRFDQGISVIVGDNGSGKTSILDAINFALFKQKPNKEINVDDLIRRGSDEAVVVIKFHSNGRSFKVRRGRKKGRASGSTLYRLEDGREVSLVKGEDEVTEEIEKLLHVNGELFTSAIYIKQGEIDSLLVAMPSKRKEHIGKLLGAQDLETAYRNAREIIDGYEKRVERFYTVPEDIKKKEQEIEDSREEIKDLKRDIEALIEGLSDKKREHAKKEKRLEELERLKELENERGRVTSEIENIGGIVKKIESYEKTLEEKEEAHNKFERLEKEINALKDDAARYARYVERGERLNQELSSRTMRINEGEKLIQEGLKKASMVFGEDIKTYDNLEKLYNEKKSELEKRTDELAKKKENLGGEIGRIKGKNEALQKAIDELKIAKDRCPTCGAKLTGEHRRELLKEYLEKIEINNRKIASASKKIGVIAEEEKGIEGMLQRVQGINLEVIRSKIAEMKEIKEEINSIKAQLKENLKKMKNAEGLGEVIERKEKERKALQDDNNSYIEARGFLRKYLSEKEEMGNKIKTLGSGLEKISKDIGATIKKIGYVPTSVTEEVAQLKEVIKTIRNEITEIEKRKSAKESLANRTRETIGRLEEELKELKEKEREYERLENFVVFLRKIRDMFHKDRLQKDLRVKARPLVEGYTKEVFDEFNLPYTDIALTDDFNILVYGPQGEESVDMLSGGERIAAALALRIGIAKALSGAAMEMIILDEPTIHLDTIRRLELVEIIKRLSTIPQTIVVTHDKEFENAADSLIMVEKEDGISKVREGI